MSNNTTSMIDAEHPWPWLEAFPEEAREFFNGRDEAIQELLHCVLAAPATVLFGKSGLGKTSLLQAGLSPLLRRERLLPVLVRLSHSLVGHQPGRLSSQLLARLEAQAQAWQLRCERPPLPEEAMLNVSDAARLWELLHDTEAHWLDKDNRRWTPVFILDQFEEIFSLVTDPAEQQQIFNELGNLIQNRTPSEVARRQEEHDDLLERLNAEKLGARFMISLREDYLPDLEIHADRIPRLGPNRYRLLPMSKEEAKEAIIKTGCARPDRPLVDEAKAQNIIAFLDRNKGAEAAASDKAGAEPREVARLRPQRPQRPQRLEPALLSLVCAGLNQDRLDAGASQLNTDSLEQRGSELLEKFYDSAFAALPEARRKQAARFVQRELITDDGTRRPYPKKNSASTSSDEHAVDDTPELSDDDLKILCDKRLLRVENTEGRELIELVHDRLATVAAQRAQRAAQEEEAARQQALRDAQEQARQKETERKQRQQKMFWTVAAFVFSVTLLGLLGVGYQWRKSNKLAVELNASLDKVQAATEGIFIQRVLSIANDLVATNPSAIQQSLLMTLAGYRIAQPSEMAYVQVARYSAMQRAAIRSAPLQWLRETSATVNTVAFSADGLRVVSGSQDGTLRLWDAKSGQPIGDPFKGHESSVYSVAFSPDGLHIVSGSQDKTLRLWDARTGQPIGEPLKGHGSPVYSVAFSPDGLSIISGSQDKTLRLWDSKSGQPIGKPLKGHTSFVHSVAFSPDGSRIVSGSGDTTLRLWDARTGQPIGKPFKGHTDSVTSAVFSSDGTRIVSGSWDATLRLWDVKSGQPIGNPLKGHSEHVDSVAFSSDGTRIVSGSLDATLRLWDAKSGQSIGEPLKGHAKFVSCVAFSPDGLHIVSGSGDKTLRLWNVRPSQAIGESLKGQSGPVISTAFSPDGARIVSASEDSTLRLWDAQSGQPIGEPLKGHTSFVRSVAFSPDGARIVSGGWDNTLRLWDAKSGQPIGEPLKGHTNSVTSTAFSPDGVRIVSGSSDNTLRLWDARTGQPIGAPFKGHTDSVSSVAFSPDGAHIVSGSLDATLRLWDAKSGQPIGAPLKGHADAVFSVAFSQDGLRIVSGSGDNTLRLWDAKSGQLIGQPLKGHVGIVSSVAFSPDGLRIVSGSRDAMLRLWDGRFGQPIGQPLKGHADSVSGVAFSPDGSRIVSSSLDGTLRIWPVFEGWASALCAKLPRNMSHKEWREWVSPDIDYITQCAGKPSPVED